MRALFLAAAVLVTSACSPDYLGPTGWAVVTRLEVRAEGLAAVLGGRYLYASVGTKLQVYVDDAPRGALALAATVEDFAMGPQKLVAVGARLYACGRNEVAAWDLSSPAAPVLLKRFVVPAVEPCADIEASDDVVLFAMPHWGVGVVDFKSPATAAVPAALISGSVPRYLTWQTGKRAWVATEGGLTELVFTGRTEATVTSHSTAYPSTFSLGRLSDTAMLIGNPRATVVVDTSAAVPATTATSGQGSVGHLHVRAGGAQAFAQSGLSDGISVALSFDLRTKGELKTTPLASNERHSPGVQAQFLDAEQVTYALGGDSLEIMRWAGP